MKTFAIILGVIVTVAVIVLAYGSWLMSGAPSFGPAPRKTPAPEGFDAAQFPDISQLASTGSIKVVDLSDYGDYFEHYYLPDLQVTYFILFAGGGMTNTVLVDRTGSVFGTIKQNARAFPMNGYFVDLDAYYEVSATDVSGPVPHELIEGPIPPAELKAYIDASTHYRSFRWRDAGQDRAEYAAELDTHVFRHEGVWKKVVTNTAYHEWKGADFARLDTQYYVTATPTAEDQRRFADGKYSVSLTHFDQQEYIRRRGAIMGSPTGQGTPEQWRGTGYYTLKAGDDDLRFSILNDAQILSGGGRVYLTLEGRGDLDFVVLKHNGRGQDKDVFVISAP
ncbi:hypothetical protein [Litoreibacter arenae]|uniref:Uncharacterized protein n=1 Tax=Litoreibacter arenae DSM 19593 TaxID=1123360 RepID=S9RSJ3_9RHOB|nr:hypothetical protein [Litoreibacter arenae]EPX81030.1 hypothetical protein thalar_00476 [Litoreibacter arenae DSM 19593]